jgi:hypothetical protein
MKEFFVTTLGYLLFGIFLVEFHNQYLHAVNKNSTISGIICIICLVGMTLGISIFTHTLK